jgi:uncharacterized protein (TIGR02217 family)
MTTFLETPVFPACPSFGFTGTPRYSVTVTQTVSGRERRNRNWARQLLTFDCLVGPRDEDTVQEILEWWHAMGGEECGFRFRDYTDFKSCRVSGIPANADQPFASTVGSPALYQLVKTYVKGMREQTRPIYKPVEGTILVSHNGAAKSEGADWTLDYATGILTPNFSVTGALKWGGEFDVPVRFDGEFPVQILDKQIQSVQFTLVELRDIAADPGSP